MEGPAVSLPGALDYPLRVSSSLLVVRLRSLSALALLIDLGNVWHVLLGADLLEIPYLSSALFL